MAGAAADVDDRERRRRQVRHQVLMDDVRAHPPPQRAVVPIDELRSKLGPRVHDERIALLPSLPTRADVDEAARTLAGSAVRTPALSSPTLDERVGAHVVIKAECEQVTGSFKYRGAVNHMAQLEGVGHVVAASSGNFGRALACVGRERGIAVTIFMPEHDGAEFKAAAVRDYGGEVRWYRRGVGERHRLRDEYARSTGAVVVQSADDRFVIAGQGTVAAELLEDAGPFDAIVVAVAGGGLLAGTALVAGGTRVVGVEPPASADMRLSLERGQLTPVRFEPDASRADALLLEEPAPLAFEVCRRTMTADDIVLVDDDAMFEAMAVLHDEFGLVSEVSGAAGLAAVLRGLVPGDRVGVVVSGGNIDPDEFARCLKRAAT